MSSIPNLNAISPEIQAMISAALAAQAQSHTPASPATPKGSGSSFKPSRPSHQAPLTGPIKK
ncbi:hypothetical protein CROQUDRAFT_658992 [Cronartium quercuum f. sp. fusiforme G11]|uniref:Uncharacterized protein n=1 Tax=Cronartium quercuum f. sp. fusiforme G11 TaxID=708437 RepID=A0A9P6NEA5_9BASI|nr:hypothetical protein CROQUDRAFT_658992 [Cronartium quercuum f. sp. fusiforme G11]